MALIASPPQQRFRNSRRFYLPFPSTEPIRDSPCWPFSEGLQPSHHWPLARCRFNSARHPLRKAIQQHKYSASSCIHSASCIALRLSLRRKTELLRSLGSRPSGCRYLCRRVLLGHKNNSSEFFSQFPHTKERVRWRGSSHERYAVASGLQGDWLCQMPFSPPATPSLVFLLFASSGDFIAPYSKSFTRQECAATGYSLLALPNARILHPHTLVWHLPDQVLMNPKRNLLVAVQPQM